MAFQAPSGTALVALVGSGTMFEVALVDRGGEPLVCKRLTPRMRAEPAGRSAIVREAKALALAKHPALPAIVEVGSDAHGPFLLETRVEGVPISELVARWRALGRPVPPRLVAHVGCGAADALAEIAELASGDRPLEMVHGDIAPDHVVLGPIGEVRFIDFGAARWSGIEPSLLGGDRGTLPYVAPEVARGDAAPSPAADVYALAATILFLATGAPPSDDREPAAMLVEVGEHGIRPDRVEAAVALSHSQRAAISRALDPDPARRPTARSFADALRT